MSSMVRTGIPYVLQEVVVSVGRRAPLGPIDTGTLRELLASRGSQDHIYNLPKLGQLARAAAAVGHDFKQGEFMASSSSNGGGT